MYQAGYQKKVLWPDRESERSCIIKKMKRSSVWISLVVFLTFAVITTVVTLGYLNGFDLNVTVQIQSLIPNSLDTFLSYFSLIGASEVITVTLLVILYLQKKLQGVFILGFYILGHTIELAGKTLIHHPSPPAEFFRYKLEFLFPTAYVQTGGSYPSGHAFRITFLMAILFMLILPSRKINRRKKTIILLFLGIFTAVMLVSRVSLGEHWTTDVIAGTALGVGLGIASGYILAQKTLMAWGERTITKVKGNLSELFRQ
jgi:membrane-associated phospholipid phosphatase